MTKEPEEHNPTKFKLDASSIILGFTGSIGSGCSYISEMLPVITNNEYQYFKLSDIIREELKKDGNNDPTVDELQTKGDELRKEFGSGILVSILLKELDTGELKANNFIIDGIKNTEEVELLRYFPNFYLFSIHADQNIRQKRVVPRIFKTKKEFLLADERDREEKLSHGQQVKKCNYLSDIIIVNNENIPEAAQTKKERYIREISQNYIKLIEATTRQEASAERPPTINELCMTMAYSLSKMSSCSKRKVGAVIADIAEIKDTTTTITPIDRPQGEQITSYPYIVSTGYNEVPMGSKKCVFHEEYQKCYRDYLQEAHAKKIKCCPNCGEKLKIETECTSCGKKFDKFLKSCPECKKEIENDFKCPKCKIEIFEEFLPGDKKTPGKLLDMCRSLHAEEVAILRLAKGAGVASENLVLYATTQPCNLCANKIVAAGINKVVYAEPYTMKEAAEILTKGGVALIPFEGVKSTAFFKLYK
jgi:deoxycytidylate deaminase